MTPHMQKVLDCLAEYSEDGGGMCRPFAFIQRATAQDRATVRRACRALARAGLAEFHKGLWTDDGAPAGAGYCISAKGRALYPEEEEL